MRVRYYSMNDMARAIAQVDDAAISTERDVHLVVMMIQSGLLAHGRGGHLYMLDRKQDNRYVIEIDATGRVLR